MPERGSHDEGARGPVRSGRPSPDVSRPASSAEKAGSAQATPTRRKPGPVPGSDAARRGGQRVREKYGSEHYRRIGAAGGKAIREQRGSDFYATIGHKGGEATKRNQGLEHYARIGRIGGSRRSRRTKASGPADGELAPPME